MSFMPSTPIKSCKKYVLSFKNSSNEIQQVGIYAPDAFNCLLLAKESYSYIDKHPNSVIRIQQKF